MNKVFVREGSQVYVFMHKGESDEHAVEVNLDGTTEIVPEYTEGFPTFTVELPSSFAELKVWINSNLRRAKGLRFYSKKISTKERKKLVRKLCLQEKKNMFKRKRQSFI